MRGLSIAAIALSSAPMLSFAQFEREVIGERIRDKFAASRKKATLPPDQNQRRQISHLG